MMPAPFVLLAVYGSCAVAKDDASKEKGISSRFQWPWETTMPSLATGSSPRENLHSAAMQKYQNLPSDEGDTPVILRTPKAAGLAGDPVSDFQDSLKRLKESISETETLMKTALLICKEKQIEDCDGSREVLEVRGKMHRLMVAMKRLAQLKPMAFKIRELKHNSTTWVKNSTTKLNAARISLSSVMLTREAIRAKIDSLEKVENQWKTSMNQVSGIVLQTQRDRQSAQNRAVKAENNRLDFLSKLEAILQGVDVGDRSAEITYERAERKLEEAEQREANAKKKIFEAEELVDKAYQQQRTSEPDPAALPKIMKKPGSIIKHEDNEADEKEVDQFGSGSTAPQPLPVIPSKSFLVPHTLLAHQLKHRRMRHHHRHHRGQRKREPFPPGTSKLKLESMKLQQQLEQLEAPLPEEDAEQVDATPEDMS